MCINSSILTPLSFTTLLWCWYFHFTDEETLSKGWMTCRGHINKQKKCVNRKVGTETQSFSFFPTTWVSDKAGNKYMIEASFDLHLLFLVHNVISFCKKLPSASMSGKRPFFDWHQCRKQSLTLHLRLPFGQSWFYPFYFKREIRQLEWSIF